MIHLIAVKSVFTQKEARSCNPTGDRSDSDSKFKRKDADKNPELCFCSSPCTVDKVSELVRMYYIKRFF